MSYYLYKGVLYSSNELFHYGVKDMHWGVRRYQNEDGSLTSLGKACLRGYDGAESDDYS